MNKLQGSHTRKQWHEARTGKLYDKRIKLTDEDRENIRARHKSGESIRSIAQAYEGVCSRRLIQFVLFPERDAKLKKNVKDNKKWLHYYDKDKWKQYMRNHRAHIKELLTSNKIPK